MSAGWMSAEERKAAQLRLRAMIVTGRPLAATEMCAAIEGLLTPRQLLVFTWIGLGLDNQTIGKALCLRVKTITVHTHYIRQALALESSREVVIVALRYGDVVRAKDAVVLRDEEVLKAREVAA